MAENCIAREGLSSWKKNCIAIEDCIAAWVYSSLSRHIAALAGMQQPEQAYSRLGCIVAYRRLSRHTVGSAVLWHIED